MDLAFQLGMPSSNPSPQEAVNKVLALTGLGRSELLEKEVTQIETQFFDEPLSLHPPVIMASWGGSPVISSPRKTAFSDHSTQYRSSTQE